MAKSSMGTLSFDTRRFDGKVYYSYTWHATKELATKRANELRRKGFKVRLVKTKSGGKYGQAGHGYLLYTRKGG